MKLDCKATAEYVAQLNAGNFQIAWSRHDELRHAVPEGVHVLSEREPEPAEVSASRLIEFAALDRAGARTTPGRAGEAYR